MSDRSLSELEETLADFQQSEDDVARIPENIFVSSLLPLLCQDVRDGAAARERVDVTLWLDLAGSAHRPIDVVGSNGSVLFRVPALMRQLPTAGHGNNLTQINYGEEVTIAQAHGRNIPGADLAHLRNVFMRAEIGVDGADVETARQWNSIRKRYGLPVIPIPGDEDTSAPAPAASTGSVASLLLDDQEDF